MADSERYEVLGKIGQGSFGVINKVRRKSDGLILCRKEICYSKMSQKEKEQLQAELSILKELKHPNIVQYFERDHLKSSQDLHLYMEYCGNGDLGQVIKRYKNKNERAPEGFVWSIFSQLVTALYKCHKGADPPEVTDSWYGLEDTKSRAGLKSKVGQTRYCVLHRDLKPENVFLDGDNNVKLGDFGLSKIIKSHDFASTYVGTPYYMSPEVCSNERYSMASDIWSLGCLIYELCTLQPPFNARSHIELFNKIKVGKFQPLPPVYSAELQKVVSSCLQTNPNNRPDTSHFLNLPIVCVMRKQHEAVQIHRELQFKIEDIEKMKNTVRNEIDSSLRREWEVKARLEIDRRVEEEKQRLNSIFEAELDKRVASILEQKAREEDSRRSSSEDSLGGITLAEGASNNNSQSQVSADDQFGLHLKVGRLSLESPAISQAAKPMKRSGRTPLTRAYTVTVNPAEVASPIDTHMADPSPMSIASLALSPRKDGAGHTSTRVPSNIFAAAEQGRQRWKPTNASALNSPCASDIDDLAAAFNDSDEEDITARSPSRDPMKKNLARKRISLAHPDRPLTKRLISAPALSSQHPTSLPTAINNAAAQPKRPVSAVPVITTSPTRQRAGPDSPSRPTRQQQSTEPSGSPIRKAATAMGFRSKRDTADASSQNGMMKTAMRNQMNGVHGRTLVELAQARAGGIPRGEKLEKSAKDCAVWDPEQDEMPSPFLVRGRKVIKAGFR